MESDDKLGVVGRDLLLVGAVLLVCLLFLVLFVFLPLEISMLLNLNPVSTLGVWLLNLLIGWVIIIYLEYRNNPNEFNIKGIRYIFTGGH